MLDVEPPKSWKDLINLSYVVGFTEQARKSAIAKRRLIHIDDPLEKVILNEASRYQKQMLKKGIEAMPFSGIYPLQNIVSTDPESESSLYYHHHSIPKLRQILREYSTRHRDF